jgi:hypothetical protein
MTGQRASNIAKLFDAASEGLTANEIAARLEVCEAYVKSLARQHGIVLAKRPNKRNTYIEKIRALASDGLTRPQVAERLGLGYQAVVKYGLQAEITFSHANRKTSPTVRTRQMAAMYQSGKTLQEIGEQYGITRERVRQLITKFHGLRAGDGGQHKLALDRRARFEAKRNAASLKQWGCNWDQYVALRDMKKPTRCWSSQRSNAAKRGIGWELNLWQWWSIWQQSGKWSERGRGQGYVMCRVGDCGPYAIGNVFIAPARENSSDRVGKKSGLPIGVIREKRTGGFIAQRAINGVKYYLGTHPTPELAHAAYLACPTQQVAA